MDSAKDDSVESESSSSSSSSSSGVVSMPAFFVLGAGQDFIVDAAGVQETARFLGVEEGTSLSFSLLLSFFLSFF
jgi:hypothetical protein